LGFFSPHCWDLHLRQGNCTFNSYVVEIQAMNGGWSRTHLAVPTWRKIRRRAATWIWFSTGHCGITTWLRIVLFTTLWTIALIE
jgi:hypothetical protein